MKKTTKLCIALLCVIGMFIGSVVILSVGGVVHLGNNGVSVDSNGKIYIGLNSQIQVIDLSGKIINRISPQTSKGYSFAVLNDNILIETGTKRYILSLDGEVLYKGPSAASSDVFKQQSTVNVGTNTYHISRSEMFYKVQIEQDGESIMVYKQPILDSIATWSLPLIMPIWAVLIITVIKHTLARKRSEGRAHRGRFCVLTVSVR